MVNRIGVMRQTGSNWLPNRQEDRRTAEAERRQGTAASGLGRKYRTRGGGAGTLNGKHNSLFPYENTKGVWSLGIGLRVGAEVTDCADVPGAPIALAGAGKTRGNGQNRRFF